MVSFIARCILAAACLFPSAQLWARDGQFLCSPLETLMGDSDSIADGSLQLSSMGINKLTWGEASSNQTFFRLDFDSRPATISAHHQRAHYKSGQQVFRRRDLQLVKSVIGTHSGVELYKTTQSTGQWPMVHDSQKTIPESFMPRETNDLARGLVYVLVGRRVALVGYPKSGSWRPKFAFCLKQDGDGMSQMTHAYALLVREYREFIKPRLGNEMTMAFEENPPTQSLNSAEQQAIVYRILDSHFSDINNAFISESGELLSLGAFMSSSALLARFLMRRGNVAAAILPPNIINEFMVMGKQVIYLPNNQELPFSELEDLFKNHSRDEMLEMMAESPELSDYLRELATEIIRQTRSPYEA